MNLTGRTHELATLIDHLRSGNHLAIHGAEGVGKTALIQAATEAMPGIVYCADTSTLKRACDALLDRFHISVNVADNIVRKRAVREAARGKKLCFIFDHVGWVTPKLLSFLDTLRESHQLVVVTRSLASADIGHLKLLLWDFDTLELKNLAHADATRLLRSQCNQLGLSIADPAQFERNVWRLSQGNPRVILDLCAQASTGRYVFDGHFDTRLLDLDRRISQLRL